MWNQICRQTAPFALGPNYLNLLPQHAEPCDGSQKKGRDKEHLLFTWYMFEISPNKDLKNPNRPSSFSGVFSLLGAEKVPPHRLIRCANRRHKTNVCDFLFNLRKGKFSLGEGEVALGSRYWRKLLEICDALAAPWGLEGAVRSQHGSLDLKEETSPAWGWEKVEGERRLRLKVQALNSNGRGAGSPAAGVYTCCSSKGEQEKVLEREMGLAFVDVLLRNCVGLGL